MNGQITKMQSKALYAMMEDKKEDNKMSVQMQLLDLHLPVKVGIHKNGLTIEEMIHALGISNNNLKMKLKIRVAVCGLVSELIKSGFPFGGLKDGTLKKYGFPNEQEFEQITFERKTRMLTEVKAGIKYLDERDPMKKICKTFLLESDSQLRLFR